MITSKITIIRHGETEWNVSMRLQGKKDSKLTIRGRKQVELTAGVLALRSFDVFISSDQERAFQTAKIINSYHKLEIIKSENLRERNFGIMEGLTREEISEKFPEVHERYINRKSNYQVPDGESLVQFYSRVTKELKKITCEMQGKNILIVSHGGVLDCTMRMVFGHSLDDRRNFSIYNAAINSFIVKDGNWYLDEWGNTEHFRGMNLMDELK